jgi:hypothetical protein
VSYLIDTNIISELRKGGRANGRVLRWYESIADSDIYLSVLVLGEIRRGIERARGRDAAQAAVLERWLREIRDAFGERVLPVSQTVADEWGRMNAARPLPAVDSLLAATAKVHGLTLVTRNVADVAGTGAKCLNPFAS